MDFIFAKLLLFWGPRIKLMISYLPSACATEPNLWPQIITTLDTRSPSYQKESRGPHTEFSPDGLWFLSVPLRQIWTYRLRPRMEYNYLSWKYVSMASFQGAPNDTWALQFWSEARRSLDLVFLQGGVFTALGESCYFWNSPRRSATTAREICCRNNTEKDFFE